MIRNYCVVCVKPFVEDKGEYPSYPNMRDDDFDGVAEFN